MLQALAIEVRGADDRERVVEGRELRVHHATPVLVHPSARGEQSGQQAARGPPQQRVIGAAGDQDLDLDAAPGGLRDAAQDLATRCEVRRNQQHPRLRLAERRHEHVAHAPSLVDRAVGQDGTTHVATLRERPLQQLDPGKLGSSGAEPALEEERLQVAQHRALDARVRIPPGRLGRDLGRVLVADVEPAHEARAIVDQQDLAVVAAPQRSREQAPAERVELDDLAARLDQRLQRRAVEPARSDRVVEHAHLDPGARALLERGEEAPPGRIGPQGVGLEVDTAASELDRLEHRGQTVATVVEQGDRVRGVEAHGAAAHERADRLGPSRRRPPAPSSAHRARRTQASPRVH